MDALLLFFVAALASFIGSLQAGLVNTAVLAHTIKRGPEAGRRMAIGGAIPEFLYAGIAFQFATLVLSWLGLGRAGIGMLVGSILMGIGLYFVFLFKPKFTVDEQQLKPSGVRRGLLVGLANPQLLLFWCGVRLSISSFGVEGDGWLELIAFALGAFAGALLLLLQLVKLGRRAVETLKPRTLLWMFRIVGMVLVLSGLYGIIRTRTPEGEVVPIENGSAQRTALVTPAYRSTAASPSLATSSRRACGRWLR